MDAIAQSTLVNAQALVLFMCAVHLGLSIDFALQRWNDLSHSGQPAPDPLLLRQLGDGALTALVAIAVIYVPPLDHGLPAGICLVVVMAALLVRLVRRARRCRDAGR